VIAVCGRDSISSLRYEIGCTIDGRCAANGTGLVTMAGAGRGLGLVARSCVGDMEILGSVC